jgi:hypothetical protein
MMTAIVWVEEIVILVGEIREADVVGVDTLTSESSTVER